MYPCDPAGQDFYSVRRMNSGYLEISEERLFIEGGRLQPERVDNVVDLGSALLERILLILSRGVGTFILF